MRKILITALLFTFSLPMFASSFLPGDIFAGVVGGVLHYRADGTFVETINTTSTYNTGMAFDNAGNLYVTQFSDSIIKVDNGNTGSSVFASGISADPESLAFDSSGNLYVGVADGTTQIRKFDSSGNLLNTYSAATGPRGTDWIDLAADQKTMYYTSEGNTIRRFDVSTNSQLANFATGTGNEMYALRILGDGSVLVANTDDILYFDSVGNLLKTFTISGQTGILFALNLDPDGTSFWTGELGGNGRLYKIDLGSGAILETINTDRSDVAGLAVFGEIRQGTGGGEVPEPSVLLLLSTGSVALLRKLRK
jgi:streptogramin lyase